MRFSVLVSLVILLSCTYEPEGLDFTNVNEPDNLGIDVDLNTADDTVYLFTKSTFGFSASLGNRKLINITGYLDSKILFSSTDRVNAFTLDARDYDAGIYTIEVRTKASSGNGSLADIAEAETVDLIQHWTLVVDKTPPTEINITDIGASQGTLLIAWEKYLPRNFQMYIINKYCFIENYGFSHCGSFTITNQQTLSLADSAFLSGRVKYDIKVKASDQMSDTTSKEFTYFFNSELKWTLSGEKTANFTWRQTPFYNNFKGYDFRHALGPADFYSTNVRDTADSFTPYDNIFSTSVSFVLTIVSKGTDRRTDHKSSTIYHNGKKFLPFTSISFNASTNRYYLQQNVSGPDTLYQINGTTLTVENKRIMEDGSTFTLSPDGKLIYSMKSRIIRRLDPNTLNVIQEHDLTTLVNDIYPGPPHSVSNDGIFVFDRGLVLDMNSFSVMNQLTMTGGDRITGLSPDGQRLYILGREYKREGNKFVKGVSVVNENVWKIKFVNADTALALTTSESITVFNPTTGTVLSKIEVPGYNDWIDYDETLGIVYVYEATISSKQPLYLFDIRHNLQGVKQIVLPYYRDYRLLNGRLICSSGYYIDYDLL